MAALRMHVGSHKDDSRQHDLYKFDGEMIRTIKQDWFRSYNRCLFWGGGTRGKQQESTFWKLQAPCISGN